MSGGATGAGGVEHGIWCQRHSSTGDTLPLPIQTPTREGGGGRASKEGLNGIKMALAGT